MIYTQQFHSPLGIITLASNTNTLLGLWFEEQKYFGNILPKDCVKKQTQVLADTQTWLEIYFSGEIPSFTPPLIAQGTPFRKSVWEILQTIPYGHTMTYKEIANKLALKRGISKMSAQAVGNAVGHNPISLIIPCHRVIGSNKSLTGYAGGLERKAWLLKLEKAIS